MCDELKGWGHSVRYAHTALCNAVIVAVRVCNRPSGGPEIWHGVGRDVHVPVREFTPHAVLSRPRLPCRHSFDHPRSVRVRRVRMLERGSCVVA